jgi:hypothetical protein
MVRHDDELVEDDAVKMQRNLDPHTRDRRAEVAEQYAVIHDPCQTGRRGVERKS